jgi:excisionase family DNA binding protein
MDARVPDSHYLLTAEAARRLGVSSATVHLWERLGRLPAVRTGGGVRLFNRRDVERLARKRAKTEADGGQREPAA